MVLEFVRLQQRFGSDQTRFRCQSKHTSGPHQIEPACRAVHQNELLREFNARIAFRATNRKCCCRRSNPNGLLGMHQWSHIDSKCRGFVLLIQFGAVISRLWASASPGFAGMSGETNFVCAQWRRCRSARLERWPDQNDCQLYYLVSQSPPEAVLWVFLNRCRGSN